MTLGVDADGGLVTPGFHRVAKAANGRVLFSTGVGEDPNTGKMMAGVVDMMRADGAEVTGMCIPRASGFLVGLQNELCWRGGAWNELRAMSFDDRVDAINDAAMATRLVTDAIRPINPPEWVFPLGDGVPSYTPGSDAGWTTFVLRYWARERGMYSVEEAVRRMTSAPAEVVGITDRGTVEPGKRADLNVIDHARLHETTHEFVRDFPNDAGRFIQRAERYVATICNGEIILENDQHTGKRPGAVLRS